MSELLCFFAGWPGAGLCNGSLIRAHLIPKQRIRREFPHGAVHVTGGAYRRATRQEGERMRASGLPEGRLLPELEWDHRVWVPVCGGPMGNAGHHGRFDARAGHASAFRIPRVRLPAALEAFAEEYGLEWSLEADYGPKET